MSKASEHKSVQQPKRPGWMISSSGGAPLTVGDLRNAIAMVDDAVEIDFGCMNRRTFKSRAGKETVR